MTIVVQDHVWDEFVMHVPPVILQQTLVATISLIANSIHRIVFTGVSNTIGVSITKMWKHIGGE